MYFSVSNGSRAVIAGLVGLDLLVYECQISQSLPFVYNQHKLYREAAFPSHAKVVQAFVWHAAADTIHAEIKIVETRAGIYGRQISKLRTVGRRYTYSIEEGKTVYSRVESFVAAQNIANETINEFDLLEDGPMLLRLSSNYSAYSTFLWT